MAQVVIQSFDANHGQPVKGETVLLVDLAGTPRGVDVHIVDTVTAQVVALYSVAARSGGRVRVLITCHDGLSAEGTGAQVAAWLREQNVSVTHEHN